MIFYSRYRGPSTAMNPKAMLLVFCFTGCGLRRYTVWSSVGGSLHSDSVSQSRLAFNPASFAHIGCGYGKAPRDNVAAFRGSLDGIRTGFAAASHAARALVQSQQMLYDVVVGFEDPLGRGLPRIKCQTFSNGLSQMIVGAATAALCFAA